MVWARSAGTQLSDSLGICETDSIDALPTLRVAAERSQWQRAECLKRLDCLAFGASFLLGAGRIFVQDREPIDDFAPCRNDRLASYPATSITTRN